MKQYHLELHKGAKVVDAFLKKVYTTIHVDGIDKAKEMFQAHPTMVTCSHRSHLDYLFVGIELSKAGLPNLRMAAGDNLTEMPILGKKLQSFGAFSVHRKRSHSRRYIFDLTKKVVSMLGNGDNIVVFPEGGRSYSGQMMIMKNGVLAANIFSQFHNPDKKHMYQPVTISYEKIPELPYFGVLEKGRLLVKRKKGPLSGIRGKALYYGSDFYSFFKLAMARKFNNQFGDIYIDFGEPLFIKDMVNVEELYNKDARNEFSAHKEAIEQVSEIIQKKLTKLYRILPVHVVSSIIAQTKTESTQKIETHIPKILDRIQQENLNGKSVTPLAAKEIVEKGVNNLKRLNALSCNNGILKIKSLRIVKYYAATLG